VSISPGGTYLAIKAGLTFIDSRLDVFMPLKYLCTKFGFIPTCAVNIPIGYLPKSISIEKLKEVDGMYEATMLVADLSPEIIDTDNTLLHLFEQSVADWISDKGR
jgi:predicted proteasome-type protease